MPKIRDIYISRRLNLEPYETLQLGISIVPEGEKEAKDGIIDLIRYGKQKMAHMMAELKVEDNIIKWDDITRITYDKKDDNDDLL